MPNRQEYTLRERCCCWSALAHPSQAGFPGFLPALKHFWGECGVGDRLRRQTWHHKAPASGLQLSFSSSRLSRSPRVFLRCTAVHCCMCCWPLLRILGIVEVCRCNEVPSTAKTEYPGYRQPAANNGFCPSAPSSTRWAHIDWRIHYTRDQRDIVDPL